MHTVLTFVSLIVSVVLVQWCKSLGPYEELKMKDFKSILIVVLVLIASTTLFGCQGTQALVPQRLDQVKSVERRDYREEYCNALWYRGIDCG
jgi:hypothetical protein